MGVVLCILLGVLLGIISKSTDVAIQGTLGGNILWGLGLVTTSFLIWCNIGYAIATVSKSCKKALVNNFSCFASMLCSYYVYSYFVVHYLKWRVIIFWVVMLVAVLAATLLIWKFGNQKPFRILCNVFVILVFAFDTFVMQGLEIIPLIMEAILLAAILVLINRRKIGA